MNDRFLRACRREPTDVTPVWFMRQAGRYMPEYRELRAKYSMLELCRTPELALQVTLQPLRLGVDAAILFADLLLPLDPMGAGFHFAAGEGPVIEAPVRTREAISKLRVPEPEESLGYVLQAIRMLRGELKVPLIGFVGAPFTLASYLIEGGRSQHFAATKKLLFAEPEAWNLLMTTLASTVEKFAAAQVRAGAQAIQVFDSWVGQLSPADYRASVLPHTKRVVQALKATGVPIILFGTGNPALLAPMAEAGPDVVGVDWRVSLSDGWDAVGHERAVQGNLDPTALLASRQAVQTASRRILEEAGGRPGHIFNVGHGILPDTSPDEVHALVDFIHDPA